MAESETERTIKFEATANLMSDRIAVYGPVRTVVWEGGSREAPPYPYRKL